MSTFINMSLAQVVKRNGVPFEVVNPKPSKELLEALTEVNEMINNPEKYPRYNNWNDLKESLLSDDYLLIQNSIFSKIKKSLKKLIKQGKNIDELKIILDKLTKKEELEPKYRNHKLIDDKNYKNCFECHIRPDWLLIYQ